MHATLLAGLLLLLLPGAALAQGNVTPQANSGQSAGRAEVLVGAGTTTEVTTGSSGPQEGGGGSGPPEAKTDRGAGRNAECRRKPDPAERVACLQGYARLPTLDKEAR